jgi:hypothetical protein
MQSPPTATAQPGSPLPSPASLIEELLATHQHGPGYLSVPLCLEEAFLRRILPKASKLTLLPLSHLQNEVNNCLSPFCVSMTKFLVLNNI